jgi:hypothetical protein
VKEGSARPEKAAAPHPFDRVNPVAKLGAALLLAACLVLTIDWASAGTALALELAVMPFLGVRPREFWLRTLPVWIAAPLTGLTILLYGQAAGTVYWEWLAIRVSDGSIDLAIATALRVLAIGLPAVVLFMTVDPTDLADGLAQVWRLPSRFVLGALAALRLVEFHPDGPRRGGAIRTAQGTASLDEHRAPGVEEVPLGRRVIRPVPALPAADGRRDHVVVHMPAAGLEPAPARVEVVHPHELQFGLLGDHDARELGLARAAAPVDEHDIRSRLGRLRLSRQ